MHPAAMKVVASLLRARSVLAVLNPMAVAARAKHTIGCAAANMLVPNLNIVKNKLVQPALQLLDSTNLHCQQMLHVVQWLGHSAPAVRQLMERVPMVHVSIFNAREVNTAGHLLQPKLTHLVQQCDTLQIVVQPPVYCTCTVANQIVHIRMPLTHVLKTHGSKAAAVNLQPKPVDCGLLQLSQWSDGTLY
jgi:hypothetical protein